VCGKEPYVETPSSSSSSSPPPLALEPLPSTPASSPLPPSVSASELRRRFFDMGASAVSPPKLPYV
jgi:hypothetical protein